MKTKHFLLFKRIGLKIGVRLGGYQSLTLRKVRHGVVDMPGDAAAHKL